MKQVSYIILVLVLAIAVGCKKEVIQPNTPIDQAINDFSYSEKKQSDSNPPSSEGTSDKNKPTTDDNQSVSDGKTGDINVNSGYTDPNRDGDDIPKDKKKIAF